jgi:hypothetical protein
MLSRFRLRSTTAHNAIVRWSTFGRLTVGHEAMRDDAHVLPSGGSDFGASGRHRRRAIDLDRMASAEHEAVASTIDAVLKDLHTSALIGVFEGERKPLIIRVC